MLLLGASSSDLKGSLNTIPEGKELRTMTKKDDVDDQPDYDVPVNKTRVNDTIPETGGDRPALPQRNHPLHHPAIRAEKAQTLPASYAVDDANSVNDVDSMTKSSASSKDRKYSTSSMARKSSHDGMMTIDLPPLYQPQTETRLALSSSSSSSSSDLRMPEIPALVSTENMRQGDRIKREFTATDVQVALGLKRRNVHFERDETSKFWQLKPGESHKDLEPGVRYEQAMDIDSDGDIKLKLLGGSKTDYLKASKLEHPQDKMVVGNTVDQ